MIRFATAFLMILTSFCWVPEYAFSKDNKPKKKQRKNQFTIYCWQRFDPQGIAYGGGDFFFRARPRSVLQDLTGEQISLSMKRQLHKSFSVEIHYTFWKKRHDYWGYSELVAPNDRVKGWVTRRWSYQHFDLMGSHHMKIYKRHSVDFSGGISYARGWDEVVNALGKDRTQPYPYYFGSDNRLSNYLGAVAQVKYDYSFGKGRWSTGINVNLRGYYQFQQPMYGAGIHASVNF
jgi:hypothetical protein